MSFPSCFCYAFVCVCIFVPCGHLLGKGWPLGSRLWCITVSLLLPIDNLGQAWYLIVSIPDFCTRKYFKNTCFPATNKASNTTAPVSLFISFLILKLRFVDLNLSITNGIVSFKIYDKLVDFNFEIVNFPFLDGDVPHSPS